jgi:magnesium chelatase subunit I
MTEIVAELSQLARRSPHVNQRSGVSARLSITNYETLVANAARRALATGEREVVPRVSDLEALAASTSGKIEIETLDDGAQGAIFDNLVRTAVLTVYRQRVPADLTRAVTQAFDDGAVIDVGEDVPSTQLADQLATIPALARPVEALTSGDDSPPSIAAAIAFVLEGLHLSKRLNKDVTPHRTTYRAR